MFDVVLASFNGAEFIAEQLESIRRSEGYDDLVERVIVVDDGSSDNTVDIVQALQSVDARIELFAHHGGLGAAKNFEYGLNKSTADWVLLSDQDDVWLANKLQVIRSAIGVRNSSDVGAVFTDLKVVDQNLNVINDSYLKLCSVDAGWADSLEQLLQQNIASGCTMALSRGLLSKALPMPTAIAMHDWWLALVALSAGGLVFVPEPTILYRQHHGNVVGAPISRLGLGVFSLSKWKRVADNFWLSVAQAIALESIFEEVRTKPSLADCGQGTTKRFLFLLRGRIRRTTWYSRVFLFFVILTGWRSPF